MDTTINHRSPDFMPGVELCRRFYVEAVRPLLATHFPEVSHAAGLLDGGSEVLGFDDRMSTDHSWGPRLQLFLSEADHARYADTIADMLSQRLPVRFLGYSTHFLPPDPEEPGTHIQEEVDEGPVNHRVSIVTMRSFILDKLNFDITQAPDALDWLTFPQQQLRTLTGGPLFADDIGANQVLQRFAAYPHDVWLYMLAAGWARIGQEEHLMGRAGLAGDEVGSAIIGARLVRDVMQLCFLMERVYAPYPKWFGTAFKQLACADLYPTLQEALAATTWQAREVQLVIAYERLARMHNALGLTEPLPEQAIFFYGRPFRIITHHGYGPALSRQIRDPQLRRLAQHPSIGSIDQFSDSTDLRSYPEWRPALRRLYDWSRE